MRVFVAQGAWSHFMVELCGSSSKGCCAETQPDPCHESTDPSHRMWKMACYLEQHEDRFVFSRRGEFHFTRTVWDWHANRLTPQNHPLNQINVCNICQSRGVWGSAHDQFVRSCCVTELANSRVRPVDLTLPGSTWDMR